MRNLTPLFCFFLLLLPSISKADDACATESDSDPNHRAQAIKFKIIAIVSILLAGAIGIGIPILGKRIPALSPEKNIFFLIKSFAAGVILATGCVHILPDAFESLTSPCLSEIWGKFPFTGLVIMISIILTLMADSLATAYYSKTKSVCGDEENLHVHTHTTHGHAHGSATFVDSGDSSQLIRHRIVSQVLELGIVVHSVIIGISLGASQSVDTIKPLVAALTFHQFFEGMGLGGCISQAKFKTGKIVTMMVFFSLTTPIGIAIGMGITNAYNENSPTALIVQGIFNAASAGILIFIALVDILVVDFRNPKVISDGFLQLGVYISLFLGAGLMSLLAIWA